MKNVQIYVPDRVSIDEGAKELKLSFNLTLSGYHNSVDLGM